MNLVNIFGGVIIAMLWCVSAVYAISTMRAGAIERRWGRLIATAAFVALMVAALWSTVPDDPRLPAPFASDAVMVFGAMCVVAYVRRKGVRLSRFAIGTCAAISVATTVVAIPVSVFRMHPMTVGTVRSPDGRYEARLIYFDGVTFGYYFVSLQKVSPLMRWLPVHEVAEAEAEGFDSVRWDGNRRLVVEYDSEAGFVKKGKRWRDVAVDYTLNPYAAGGD